jgi:hypothetical protein
MNSETFKFSDFLPANSKFFAICPALKAQYERWKIAERKLLTKRKADWDAHLMQRPSASA